MNAAAYSLTTGEIGTLFPGVPNLEACPTLEGCDVIELPEGANPNDYCVNVSVDPHVLEEKTAAEILESSLAAEKAQCLSILADRVMLEQGHYLTSGKDAIYRAKSEEVKRFDADASPVAANYPHAEQAMTENSSTLAEAIDLFRTREAETNAALVQIDTIERSTKSQIKGASTLGAPMTILKAAVWPSTEG